MLCLWQKHPFILSHVYAVLLMIF